MPKTFENIAKIHSNQKAILSSRIIVKTPVTKLVWKHMSSENWNRLLHLAHTTKSASLLWRFFLTYEHNYRDLFRRHGKMHYFQKKNAFGEVDQELITCVFKVHHVPNSFIQLIVFIYRLSYIYCHRRVFKYYKVWQLRFFGPNLPAKGSYFQSTKTK